MRNFDIVGLSGRNDLDMLSIVNFIFGVGLTLLNGFVFYSCYDLYFRNWSFTDYRFVHFMVLLVVINGFFVNLHFQMSESEKITKLNLKKEEKEFTVLFAKTFISGVSLGIVYLCQPGLLWN